MGSSIFGIDSLFGNSSGKESKESASVKDNGNRSSGKSRGGSGKDNRH